MNPEDIKTGQKYNLTLLAIDKERCRRPALFETPTGKKYFISPEDFESVSPENGIKNTEPASKYDPCRKFRKGDKVRVVEYKGRTPKNSPTNEGYVLKEENDCNTVIVNFGEYGRWQINVAYLELITPVKELEPYRVGTGIDSQLLYCNSELFADDNGVHSHVFGAKATKNSSSVQAGSSTRAAGPFTVEGDADEKEFSVVIGTRFVASFPYGRGSFYTEPGAKAAAQDECDRLNEQYRKEVGEMNDRYITPS